MSDPRPLRGRRVVVTRARRQTAELTAAFEAAGAEVALLPLIEVVPPADPTRLEQAGRGVGAYDWLVFTSVNAVQAFLPLVSGELPTALELAAVGPATAKALADHGLEPRLVAQRPDARGLARELAGRVAGRRVLLPQAADARPVLADGLRAAGAHLTVVEAYRKELPTAAPAEAGKLFAAGPLGWVTFTSPRIVRHFVDVLGPEWPARRDELRAISIGPVTSAELRRQRVEPAAEAESPEPEAMVAAVLRSLAG